VLLNTRVVLLPHSKVLVHNKNDLVLKERKLYITKDKNLRLEIFQLHHETPIVGYGE